MAKGGSTSAVGPNHKFGVVSRELFHGAKTVQKFEDGGPVYADPDLAASAPDERNIRGEKVGKYDGNDEIVKYRMNMTDGVGGKSLRYQDNPDMMPGKSAPEDRMYDSIDSLIAAEGVKKAKKPDDDVYIVPNAAAPKAAAPKRPKAKSSSQSFSDDARSPDQVAAPSEFPEEAGDKTRNDVRYELPEEAGAGVPSSAPNKRRAGTDAPKLYYSKK